MNGLRGLGVVVSVSAGVRRRVLVEVGGLTRTLNRLHPFPVVRTKLLTSLFLLFMPLDGGGEG